MNPSQVNSTTSPTVTGNSVYYKLQFKLDMTELLVFHMVPYDDKELHPYPTS